MLPIKIAAPLRSVVEFKLSTSLRARVYLPIIASLLAVTTASNVGGTEKGTQQAVGESAQSVVVAGTATQGDDLRQHRLIDSGSISINDLEDAGETFISFYNNFLPISKAKDATDVCLALATSNFVPQCEAILNKRISRLKGLSGLTGAQFPEGKITVNEGLKDAVDIKWKEVLIVDKIPQAGNHHVRLFYAKIGDSWRIRQIDELE